MTELVLVEGVSDVQLISYYLQNVYGWKHENENTLKMKPLDEHEHIETLFKNGKQLILCGVGGNGKFAYFVDRHRVNSIIIDEASDAKVRKVINSSLEKVSVDVGQWKKNEIEDLYGLTKIVNTYLLIIPANEKGALERVIIDALNDIPEETALIHEVVQFIDSLKEGLVPELNQTNKANKATVGTFFSVRYPKDAMRKFGVVVSKIDWSKSESLRQLFSPFQYLGEEKTVED